MSQLDDLFAPYGRTITAAELAELLHVKLPSVYEMLKRGALPAYKAGSGWVIVTEEIKQHLIKNRNAYDGESNV